MAGGQRHAPATLPPEKTRYPLCRKLGGAQDRSGRVRKISPPPGFDPPNCSARSESLYPTELSRPTFFGYQPCLFEPHIGTLFPLHALFSQPLKSTVPRHIYQSFTKVTFAAMTRPEMRVTQICLLFTRNFCLLAFSFRGFLFECDPDHARQTRCHLRAVINKEVQKICNSYC